MVSSGESKLIWIRTFLIGGEIVDNVEIVGGSLTVLLHYGDSHVDIGGYDPVVVCS